MATILEDISIKPLNSFSIDQRADRLVKFSSLDDLRETLAADPALTAGRWYLLGGGNNTLFTDDFKGTLIHPESRGICVESENGEEVIVVAEAGVEWDDLVAWSVERGYWGLENLSLIPGQVGAAPVQNIGAYGAEAKDVILSVETLDTLSLEKRTFGNEECDFGYRHSLFKHINSLRMAAMFGREGGTTNAQCGAPKGEMPPIVPVITSVRFRLSKSPKPDLRYGALTEEVERLGGATLSNIRKAVISIRESKLPDPKKLGNAGSFFKNPVVDAALAAELKARWPQLPTYATENEQEVKLAAGWLIEQAGWKGRSSGNAAVHDRQALVLVNKTGCASGREIIELAGEVARSVKERFGVDITPEVNIL